MLLNLYNDTDKALLIIYENERFDLLSNSSVRLEINEAAHIEIFGKKSSKKGFSQRFKEELSLNEIDLPISDLALNTARISKQALISSRIVKK